MMGLSELLDGWSTNITIYTLVSSTANEYGQYSYNSASTIQGRLVQTEEEVNDQRAQGAKIIADAKLFTKENLDLNTKVGSHLICTKKECKDKDNNIIFYKYFLSRKHMR